MAWPKGVSRKPVSEPSENTGESLVASASVVPATTPVVIHFDAVRLEFEAERLGTAKGLASTTTSRFSRESGNDVTLDLATGLVTISHRSGSRLIVPLHQVRFFEPLRPETK